MVAVTIAAAIVGAMLMVDTGHTIFAGFILVFAWFAIVAAQD